MDGHGKAPLEYPCKGAEKGDQMDTDCRHAAQLIVQRVSEFLSDAWDYSKGA